MSGDIEHPFVLALVFAACFPMYRAWASLLFGSWQNAFAAVRWIFVRDTASFLRGDYEADKFAELRLALWLVLCGVTVLAAYQGVSRAADWLGT